MASTQSAKPAFTFPAQTFQKLHPTEYFKKFISEGVRPDGRTLDGFRPTTVHQGVISTANGSAMVRIGGTTVVCGIKAEVAEPKIDAPTLGFLVPNVDLSPMCSSSFKPGPPSEQAQVVSDAIDRILKDSKVLDLSTLVIEEGKAVWALWADVVCVSYDGNIYDAALTAIIAALGNARIRTPKFEDGIVRVPGKKSTSLSEAALKQDRDDNTFSLTLNRRPLSATFAIFDTQNTLLADPNNAEEAVSQNNRISITVDEKGQLCGVSKIGGGPCSKELMADCVSQARKRYAEVAKIIVAGATQ